MISVHKVFGAIGMLVGGGIVAHWWFHRSSADALDATDLGAQTPQAYLAVFGALIFVFGLAALLEKTPRNPWSKR